MSKAKSVSKRLEKADRKVARVAGKQRDTLPVRALGVASEVGDQPPLIALSIATAVVGAALRNPHLARTGIRMLAAHALATATKSFIKHRIDRSRPHAWLNGKGYTAKRGASRDPDLNSFPSGHTAGAVAVAAAIAREYPAHAVPGYAAAASIAALQLPRAKHHLSDVVVGAAIGAGSEWIASRALDAAENAFLRQVRPIQCSVDDLSMSPPRPGLAGVAAP